MPHPASFRIAMLDDVGCILPMVRELYALDHIPFDEQRVRAALLDLLQHPSYGCAWVILDGAEPAGYLIVTFDFSLEYGGREAFIDELFIRESRRHQGFGMLAVAHAEAFCRERDVRALHLEVDRANVAAQQLYRRAGFVDHDRYLMTKRL